MGHAASPGARKTWKLPALSLGAFVITRFPCHSKEPAILIGGRRPVARRLWAAGRGISHCVENTQSEIPLPRLRDRNDSTDLVITHSLGARVAQTGVFRSSAAYQDSPSKMPLTLTRRPLAGLPQPKRRPAALPPGEGDNRGKQLGGARASNQTKCLWRAPALSPSVRRERPISEFLHKRLSELRSNVAATFAHCRDASAARKRRPQRDTAVRRDDR
jgi:hypothetical protein